MLLWPFNKYPGTDYETFNWEWILKTVKEWVATMQTFKNSITAAWDAMRADWKVFKTGMSEDWQDYQDDMNDQWQGYHDDMNNQWQEFIDDTYKDQITEILEDHPEWVTTVMDGAITKPKINAAFLKEIENYYVTPEMFGAAGDGVTDDLAAINTCLTTAKETKKAVLFLSIYAISDTLTIPSEVDICGVESEYSGLKLTGTAESVIVCNGNSSVDQLSVDGNNLSDYAINISAPYTNVNNCIIKGGNKAGIIFKTTYCNVIYNNRIYGGEYAIICNFAALTNAAAHNATTISDNIIINASKYALVIGGGDSWRIINNTIEYCRLGVAVFNSIHTIEFSGNYLENNGKYSSPFTMSAETFYIRPIIVFKKFVDGSTALEPGGVVESAIISNNFVNIANAAADNTIPTGYDDISTFVLAAGVEDLTINNNVCLSSGTKQLLMFGSRSANSSFDKCLAFNNKGFEDVKMIGKKYSVLTVKPDITIDNVVKYNYFSNYDFSDFTGLTFTDTNNKIYGNKVYECSTSNVYGNFYASYPELAPLQGKTALLGFWAKIPTGVTVGFYSNAGIPFSEECVIRNMVFDQWTFIGMALEVPENISTDFRFYVQFHGIDNTPVQVAGLYFAEIGNPISHNIK